MTHEILMSVLRALYQVVIDSDCIGREKWIREIKAAIAEMEKAESCDICHGKPAKYPCPVCGEEPEWGKFPEKVDESESVSSLNAEPPRAGQTTMCPECYLPYELALGTCPRCTGTTEHLLSNPANAEHLRKSLAEAERGEEVAIPHPPLAAGNQLLCPKCCTWEDELIAVNVCVGCAEGIIGVPLSDKDPYLVSAKETADNVLESLSLKAVEAKLSRAMDIIKTLDPDDDHGCPITMSYRVCKEYRDCGECRSHHVEKGDE